MFNSGAAVPVTVGKTFSSDLTAPGAKGGEITNITLADGVGNLIGTGSGRAGDATHAGGAGGNITKLVSVSDQSFNIFAGNGGSVVVAGAQKNAGAGGSISDLNITLTGEVGEEVRVSGGDGGGVGGTAIGSGGKGGSLSKITIKTLGTVGGDVIASAGSGGDGLGAGGLGGAGGEVLGRERIRLRQRGE